MNRTSSGRNASATCICAAVLTIGMLALAGCTQTDSCNIKTPAMYCGFAVVEAAGQATVTAVFSVGGPLGSKLALGPSCGDDIKVNGVAMQEIQGLFVFYQAIIQQTDTYELEFTRSGEGVYKSTVTPPPPVNITAPADGTAISRASAFDITWDANGGANAPNINLLISGSCINGLVRDIADNGLYTINIGEITASGEGEGEGEGETVNSNCDASIVLTRTITGTMAQGLIGAITGQGTDQVGFSTTP